MWVEELIEAVATLRGSSHGYALFEIVGTPYYVQLYRLYAIEWGERVRILGG